MRVRPVSPGAQAVYLAGLGVLSRREVTATARVTWEYRAAFDDRPWGRVRVVHLYSDCAGLAPPPWTERPVRRFSVLAWLARYGTGPGRRGARTRPCSTCWLREPVALSGSTARRPLSHLDVDLAAASGHVSWSVWAEVVLAGRLPLSDPAGEVHAGVARLLAAQYPLLGPVPSSSRTGPLAEVLAAQAAALAAPLPARRRGRRADRVRGRGGRPVSSVPPRCAVGPRWVWVVVHPRVLDVAVAEVGQLVVAAQLRMVASSSTPPVPVADQGWLLRVPAARLAALRAGGSMMDVFAAAVTTRSDAEPGVVQAALRLYGRLPLQAGYRVAAVDELVDALEAARG